MIEHKFRIIGDAIQPVLEMDKKAGMSERNLIKETQEMEQQQPDQDDFYEIGGSSSDSESDDDFYIPRKKLAAFKMSGDFAMLLKERGGD